MTETKPLFVPLKTEWFRQFEDGSKDTEYRAYGPRWNEKTCTIDRPVTLSHGYSGKRLSTHVVGFAKMSRAVAPKAAQDIYPNAEFIAAIGVAAQLSKTPTSPTVPAFCETSLNPHFSKHTG